MRAAGPKVTTKLPKGTVPCLYDQALIEMSTNLSRAHQVGAPAVVLSQQLKTTVVAYLDATAKERVTSRHLVPAS